MKKIIIVISLIMLSLSGGCQTEIVQHMMDYSLAIDSLDISGRTNLLTYGDSFTNGQGASVASLAWAELFKTHYFSTRTNSAVSGSGVWRSIKDGIGASYTKTTTVTTMMAGLNDIRRGGDDINTLNKIEACYRAMMCKSMILGTVAGGSSGCTRVGSFVNYDAVSKGGLYYNAGTLPRNTACFSFTSGDYWEYTFTGTAVGVYFIATQPGSFGHCDVTIDGVPVQTIDTEGWYDGVSDGVYDNQYGPLAYSWHGLSAGSHTIRITVGNSGAVVVDFFFTVSDPSASNAFIAFEIPYLNSTGYATAPAFGSTSASAMGSARILKVINEYRLLGYPCMYVPLNGASYKLSTGLGPDNIHPNDTGHDQIYNAVLFRTYN